MLKETSNRSMKKFMVIESTAINSRNMPMIKKAFRKNLRKPDGKSGSVKSNPRETPKKPRIMSELGTDTTVVE